MSGRGIIAIPMEERRTRSPRRGTGTYGHGTGARRAVVAVVCRENPAPAPTLQALRNRGAGLVIMGRINRKN